jgi:hypothetical protein
MQETSLGNPAAPFDEFLMENRNLAGWPPEADESQLEPKQEGFAPADGTQGLSG